MEHHLFEFETTIHLQTIYNTQNISRRAANPLKAIIARLNEARDGLINAPALKYMLRPHQINVVVWDTLRHTFNKMIPITRIRPHHFDPPSQHTNHIQNYSTTLHQ
eukprot:462952_1